MKLDKSTAVGLFVLTGLSLCAGAIILLGGVSWFTPQSRAIVYFQDSVAGLTIGAPVTLRGVKIGTVRDMKVYVKLPDARPVIPVYLEIDPGKVSWTTGSRKARDGELDLAIKAGLRAQLATQSLVTGQLSVNLDFHPEAPASLSGIPGDIPEIPSMASDIQNIKDEIADLKLPELAEKARLALDGIQRIVVELSGHVGPMAGSLEQTSDAARKTLETATEAVRLLQADSARTLASIDRLAIASQNQVTVLGKNAERVLTAVDRATAKAEILIGSLNDMTGPRAPLRGDVEAAIRDLAASASSLREFTRDLRRDPAATLTGRSAR